MTVREDSGGAPGPIKYTLSLAGNTSPILNFTTTTTVNFDAPEDAKLYASAKCWVVVAPSAATEIHYPLVSAGTVDSGAATGWTFNGRVNTQPISETSFLGHPFNATLQMAIVGHETSEILVSNSGQTDSSRIGIGPFLAGDFETAQSFSTGRNPDGYVLASATINLGGGPTRDDAKGHRQRGQQRGSRSGAVHPGKSVEYRQHQFNSKRLYVQRTSAGQAHGRQDILDRDPFHRKGDGLENHWERC